jgi:membrane protein
MIAPRDLQVTDHSQLEPPRANEEPQARPHVTTAPTLSAPAAHPRSKQDSRRDPSRPVNQPERQEGVAPIPDGCTKQGWKDLLRRVYHNASEHRITSIAAGVAFYVLLAIFPGIAALVSIYGLFADPSIIGQHLSDLSNVLPSGAIDIIRDQLQRLVSQGAGHLGFAFLFGVAVSLWSANAGMKALFDALNVVHGETEQRGLVELNVISLAFTLGALVFMIVALAAITVLPVVMSYVKLPGATAWLIALGKWPLLLIIVATAIATIYRFGPSRQGMRWRWLTWGSAVAALAWLIVSVLFSWYVTNFGSYDKTYGSLGAAIGFMTWIWLSSGVVLLGAALDAELAGPPGEAKLR